MDFEGLRQNEAESGKSPVVFFGKAWRTLGSVQRKYELVEVSQRKGSTSQFLDVIYFSFFRNVFELN